MAGASYFIGMSGVSGQDLGLLTLTGPNAPGDDMTAIFNGAAFQRMTGDGDMAFRLEGTVGADLEPASWLMGASAGVIGLAVARRRRRAA